MCEKLNWFSKWQVSNNSSEISPFLKLYYKTIDGEWQSDISIFIQLNLILSILLTILYLRLSNAFLIILFAIFKIYSSLSNIKIHCFLKIPIPKMHQ